ncbi:hypothetical protein [Neptuniibacter sp. QD37_11]|uniref:hypothetical protein n=1 Tax=Neptuniibacter sp. QD37_11 TaxID=3398209 RepID=UPI0039F50245
MTKKSKRLISASACALIGIIGLFFSYLMATANKFVIINTVNKLNQGMPFEEIKSPVLKLLAEGRIEVYPLYSIILVAFFSLIALYVAAMLIKNRNNKHAIKQVFNLSYWTYYKH